MTVCIKVLFNTKKKNFGGLDTTAWSPLLNQNHKPFQHNELKKITHFHIFKKQKKNLYCNVRRKLYSVMCLPYKVFIVECKQINFNSRINIFIL